MKRDDGTGTDYPAQEEERGDNEEVGLNDNEEPSALAYESESAAPLTRAYRDEVEERLADRSRWQTGNETDDPAGNETENGPEVDPNDPNLSATLTEAGVEERKEELGMSDIEEFLDDPENGDEDEDSESFTESGGGQTLNDTRDGRTGNTSE